MSKKRVLSKVLVGAVIASTLSTGIVASAQEIPMNEIKGWIGFGSEVMYRSNKSSSITEPIEISIGTKSMKTNPIDYRQTIEFISEYWSDNEIYLNPDYYGNEFACYSNDWSTVECYMDGHAIQLVGKKPGTATVFLQQKINGVWKTIESRQVIVKDSYLTATGNYSHDYALGKQNSQLWVANMKKDATYTFKTSDEENVKVYAEESEPEWVDVGFPYMTRTTIYVDAKKSGTYTVDAYETYNGVTKKFQTVKFTVHDMYVPDTIEYSLSQNMFKGYIVDAVKYIPTYLTSIYKNHDGTPSFITGSYNAGDISVYEGAYGSVPNKCMVIQRDWRIPTFTQKGTCLVDVYTYNPSLFGDYDGGTSDLTFVKTITVNVVD